MRRLAEEFGADARGLSPNNLAAIMERETKDLDARFFCGTPDVAELPGAYKNAANVRAQIAHYGLAEIVDEVIPYGCIMAGNLQQNGQGRRKRMRR
jgi:hypothetical protein